MKTKSKVTITAKANKSFLAKIKTLTFGGKAGGGKSLTMSATLLATLRVRPRAHDDSGEVGLSA